MSSINVAYSAICHMRTEKVNSHKNRNGITTPPLDNDYYSNQQIPPVILLGLYSSSKRIKDSNGQTTKQQPQSANSK